MVGWEITEVEAAGCLIRGPVARVSGRDVPLSGLRFTVCPGTWTVWGQAWDFSLEQVPVGREAVRALRGGDLAYPENK